MGAIKHQFGFAEEVTYGTAVTPARFLEFTSEGLQRNQNIGGSDGIRPGTRYGRGSTRRITRQWAEGNVQFEVATAGFGLFFEQLLGTVATTQPDIPNSPTVYLHTFTPTAAGASDTAAPSLTLQKGVEKNDGTVQAFTYPGSKVRGVNFTNDQDGVLLADIDFLCKQELTATALATASYTAPTVFHYAQGAVKVDASTVANVRSVGSVNIANNLVPRFNMGNNGLMQKPINRPFDLVGGNFSIEFANLTDYYNAFAADTSVEIVLEYVGDVITDNETSLLRITLADGRFEGVTPTITDTDIVVSSVPFSAWDPASGAAVTIEYQTTDTTP